MNKEKAVEAKKPAPPPMVRDEVAAHEVIASDMVVPYVLLVQPPSEAATQGKAAVGDIIRSTTFEKLGGPQKPIEVIFLHYPKAEWIIEEKPKGAGRFEYRRAEARNAANEVQAWSWFSDEEDGRHEVPEGTKNATEWRRVKVLRVFAVLKGDIDAANAEMKKAEAGELPDPNKALTPIIMSFRSTSYKAGKDICTFVEKAASFRMNPWRYIVPLTCHVEQNDQGTFYVWDVDAKNAKGVSKEDIPMVENWGKVINSGAVLKTDDQGVEDASPVSGVSDEAKAAVC
jgi:hypothetical protein